MDEKVLRIFALGGNEISPSGEVDPVTKKLRNPNVDEQWQRSAITCELLAEFISKNLDDYFILTHGNGPQVGNILSRSEYASGILHTVPLDVCGADTQGAIGYMLAQLTNFLSLKGVRKIAAETVTQVIVDGNDPAFNGPTKFIGPALTKDEATKRMQQGQIFKFYKKDNTGGEIWRRVVPSPLPIEVLELDIVDANLKAGIIPIAVGGGGIPVVRVNPVIEGSDEVYRGGRVTYRRKKVSGQKDANVYSGVEGVIDKDLASALLGTSLIERYKKSKTPMKAEFTIFTDVDCVKINYQKPDQRDIREIKVYELKKLYEQGLFPEGSMGPKVKAVINFIDGGGDKAYITSVARFEDALAGKAGTVVTK